MAGRAYVGISSHIVRRGLARKIASTPTGVPGLYKVHQDLGDLRTAIDIIQVVDLLVDGSSSQDLVQNGGPSAPLVQRGTSSDVTTDIRRKLGALKTTASGKRRSRRKKCPPGHFFNKYTGKCQPYIKQPNIRYTRGKR